MNLLPDKQLFLIVPFESSKSGKNELFVDNKVQKLLEMYTVQQVETKSVFTFQPKKWLVSATVKSAKPDVTLWIFLLRTKNWQLCCLVVTVRIILQGRRVATTEKKSHLYFWRSFSANQSQANTNPHQKRLKWVQIWNKRIRFLLVDDLSNIFNFQIIRFNFNLQSTYRNSWSSQYPTTESNGVSILVPTLLLLQ